MIEYFTFAFVVGQLIGPSRDYDERVWRETEMRVCAAAQDAIPDHDLRDCVVLEMKRKEAAMKADLKAGNWRGMKDARR